LLVLAGGPLWASAATLLVRSRLGGALGGWLGVADTVGSALLAVDSIDGPTGSLAVGPLGQVVGLWAEGPFRVGDVVGAPVLLDLGGGLAPGPPPPSRLRHGSERFQDMAGTVLLDS
jgi:hypothetical protein